MSAQLKRSIVQLNNPYGVIQGTGFLLDQNIVVTCAHVVTAAGSGPGQTVEGVFAYTGKPCTFTVQPQGWRDPEAEDIALLQLEDPLPEGVTPVTPGASSLSSNHHFSAFGYPNVGDIQGVWAQGIILGPTTNSTGVTMLQIRAHEIVEGMSGAPVLDIQGKQVVGMVTATYYPTADSQKLRDVAFATPIETIAKIYPDMPLVELPSAPHLPILLNQTPPLPRYYVPRPEITDPLKNNLLDPTACTPGTINISAIQGLGGIGKSTVAIALCYDPTLQKRFKDGILWAMLGRQPDLLSILTGWIQVLGNYDFQTTSITNASTHLRGMIQYKSILIVLDDVWQSDHLPPLLVSNHRSFHLVTTRRPDVVDELGADYFPMEVMSPVQTMRLLAARLGRAIESDERRDALHLAQTLGFLPLALELASARVARGATWQELRQALNKDIGQLEALETPIRRRREESKIQASFNLSLQALRQNDEITRQAFIWLGILPKEAKITAPMAATLWQISLNQAADTLEILWNEALLLPGAIIRIEDTPWPSYRMHDLLHEVSRRLIPHPTPDGLGLSLAEAHAQLLQNYRQHTHNGQWHTLPPDGYIHTYLTHHLEQAGQFSEIHRLLNEATPTGQNGWYHARRQLGQPGGFLTDVNRAMQLLPQEMKHTLPFTPLGLHLRYLLMVVSLNSLFKNIPVNLLLALVRKNVWLPEQGFAHARQVPDIGQRVEALIELSAYVAPEMQQTTVKQALIAVEQIHDEWQHTEILMWVGERLAQLGQPGHALMAAQAINNERWQAEILRRLIPYLPPPTIELVLSQAVNIQDDESRTEVLASLLPQLPDQQRPKLLDKILVLTANLDDEEYVAEIIGRLAPHLPPEECLKLLKFARSIEWEGLRAEALGEVAPYLPNNYQEKIFTEAIIAAQMIRYDEQRIPVLIKLAPHLPLHLLLKVVVAAWRIKSQNIRAKTIAQLLQYMPPAYKIKAELEVCNVIENTADPIERVRLVTQLAQYLSPPLYNRLIANTLNMVMALRQPWQQAETLTLLLPHLPDSHLAGTLKVARSLKNIEKRTLALTLLAPRIAALHRPAEAMATARAIPYPNNRAKTLVDMLPHLPTELKAVALQEATEAAISMENDVERSAILATLAPQLASNGYSAQALKLVQSIWYEKWQVKALIGVVDYLPKEQLVDALKLAHSLRDKNSRTEAVVALAPLLSSQQLTGLFEMVHSIRDNRRRAAVLLGLTPYLPEQQSQAAMQGMLTALQALSNQHQQIQMLANILPYLSKTVRQQAQEIIIKMLWDLPNDHTRAELLTEVVVYLPRETIVMLFQDALAAKSSTDQTALLLALTPNLTEAQLAQTLNHTVTLHNIDEPAAARLLVGLAPFLTTSLSSTALDIIKTVDSNQHKASILAALIPFLPASQLDIALAITRTISDKWRQAEALAELALRLTHGEQPQQALEIVHSIWDKVKRAETLARMLPLLPPALAQDVLTEYLLLYRGIWHIQWRSELLVKLAPYLPAETKNRLFEYILGVVENLVAGKKRRQALQTLIPHIPQHLLLKTINIIKNIEPNSLQAPLLSQLIPRLPKNLLQPAIHTAQTITNPLKRVDLMAQLALYAPKATAEALLLEALKEYGNQPDKEAYLVVLAPRLADLSPERLDFVWANLTPYLAQYTRTELLAALQILQPVIIKLGDSEVISDLSQAIQDVGRWWP